MQAGAVEKWATDIAEEHGFTEVHHTVEVFGFCSRCTAERRSS
ncbi:putative ferric uptake regulator FurB [Mycobacteroides abscessus subsp. abscessus]|nr:putative ferric uptake regulator FurB [Mycobacteroides abscessus subsp. abscessus]